MEGVSHAAHWRKDLLKVVGRGEFHQSRNCFRVWAYTRGRCKVSRKSCARGFEASLLTGELEVVFAQVFDLGWNRLDVGRWIRVKKHHVVEVGRRLCQTFNDFGNQLDEPDGRSTAALGHDEQLVEACRSAKHRERNGVLISVI